MKMSESCIIIIILFFIYKISDIQYVYASEETNGRCIGSRSTQPTPHVTLVMEPVWRSNAHDDGGVTLATEIKWQDHFGASAWGRCHFLWEDEYTHQTTSCHISQLLSAENKLNSYSQTDI